MLLHKYTAVYRSCTLTLKFFSFKCFVRIALWLPFDPLGVKRFLRAVARVKAYVGEQIQTHRKTFDPNNVRDYIDAFLVEQQKRASDDSSVFFGKILLGTSLLD